MNKAMTYFTATVMVMILVGIFVFVSYTNRERDKMDGTLVKAFSQDVQEYCL